MTRGERLQREYIEKGINRYKYLLDNPNEQLEMTNGTFYIVSDPSKALCITDDEMGFFETTGDFETFGKAEIKPKEYTIDEFEAGKEYLDVKYDIYYRKKADGVLEYSHMRKNWNRSSAAYNSIKESTFVEVKDEKEEI